MTTRLLWLACAGLLLAPAAAQAQGSWTGAWRLDTDASGTVDPELPYLLRITRNEQQLVVERNWMDANKPETLRYPLDGSPAANVEAGQPLETTTTVDGATITVTAIRTLPDGRVVRTTDVYWVVRNRLEIERTEFDGNEEAKSRLVFHKLPANVPLHGGVPDHHH